MPAPIVHVTPFDPNPTHDVSLSDGISTYGLNIEGGFRALKAIPQTASTLRFTGGNGKFGDYEPALSHIEQRTWIGGRGGEDFADDATKYFDAHHAWTLTPGRIMPGPEQVPARGLRTQQNLSRKIATSSGHYKFFWKQLISTTRGIATYFVAPSNITADKCYCYIRRIGYPGTLTFQLRSDSTNSPGSVLKTVTVTTAANITDWEGVWYCFDWSTTQALVSGTGYWIDVVGDSTDNSQNHWLIGTSQSTNRIASTNEYATSSDGTTWSATESGFAIFHNIVQENVKRTFKFFTLDGLLYAVSLNDAGGNSLLYVNGTRGKITSAGTSFVDTNNSDTVEAGSQFYILRGTGAGYTGVLVSGTPAGALTYSPIQPGSFGTDSEYIIYNTSLWKEITGHGLGVVKDVVVANNIAYFAQGATTIRKMRFNAGAAPPAHEFANDATDDADHIALAYKDTKPVIWIGTNADSTVKRADTVAWASTMTFGTGIVVGDSTWGISEMVEYDDGLAVGKPDGIWLETESDKFNRLPVDLHKQVDPTNATAMLSKDLFLYFNFQFSVEKYYSGTLSDIGPWKGTGLPANRIGPVVALEGGIGLVFMAIDGGASNYSSVLATDGIGFCEIFRSPATGERVRAISWQSQPGTHPRLWVECAGDMFSLDFPYTTLNPANDDNFLFTHECSLTTSTIDMDSATLYKYLKSMALATKNLQKDLPYLGEIDIDYQVDDAIGYDSAFYWTPLSKVLVSPYDEVKVDQGAVRAIRFRFRFYAANPGGFSTTIPQILGTVLSGYSRTPIKYQYICPVKLSDYGLGQSGTPDAGADELYAWLKAASTSARKITMRSRWKFMDDVIVVVEPPTLAPDGSGNIAPETGATTWKGNLTLILREV